MGSLKNLIVVKVGTNTLTTDEARLDLNVLRHLVEQLVTIQKDKDVQVILVTSGAITCGAHAMGIQPKTVEDKQAAASVGQILLMNEYAQFFNRSGQSVGQILLTKDCMVDPIRKKNVKNTIFTLLKQGVLPIINENDSVATDEIGVKFGDNDELSAGVAQLVKANRLILLTDTEGLYTANPKEDDHATLIPRLAKVSRQTLALVQDTPNGRSRGGMTSKLTFAKQASDAGIEVVLANGRRADVVTEIMQNKAVGTWISAQKKDKT